MKKLDGGIQHLLVQFTVLRAHAKSFFAGNQYHTGGYTFTGLVFKSDIHRDLRGNHVRRVPRDDYRDKPRRTDFEHGRNRVVDKS